MSMSFYHKSFKGHNLVNYQEIVERIIEVCGTRNQTAIASRLGVSQNLVSMWMSGERNPSLKALEKIVNDACLTWDWLLEGRGPMRRE